MIHLICKTYGLSKEEGGRHTETDFWELLLFENLDAERGNYLSQQLSELENHGKFQ